MVSIDEPGSWEPLLESAASEGQPAVSPDGRWLSYSSTESGVREVYIRRFPGLEDRRPISVGGGFTARWSSDSRELTYQRSPGGPPDAMMRVPIDVDSGSPPSLVVGTPELLFEWRYFSQAGGIQYSDVTPDGQRFLMIANRTDGEGTSNQLVLIQNWFEELRRLVPVP